MWGMFMDIFKIDDDEDWSDEGEETEEEGEEEMSF